MTLEHATTKTSGFRFTLADLRGVFYEESGPDDACNIMRGLTETKPITEVSNGS